MVSISISILNFKDSLKALPIERVSIDSANSDFTAGWNRVYKIIQVKRDWLSLKKIQRRLVKKVDIMQKKIDSLEGKKEG